MLVNNKKAINIQTQTNKQTRREKEKEATRKKRSVVMYFR